MNKEEKVFMIGSIVCCIVIFLCMIWVDYNGYFASQQIVGQQEEETQPDEEMSKVTESAPKEEQKWDAIRALREDFEQIVVLDAGHGGLDDGASVDGVLEKEAALEITLLAGNLLEQKGVKVLYTRDADVLVEDEERVKLANEVKADCFISIHAFEDEDSSVYGMKTKYNDRYFQKGFTSGDLAYVLLEKTANLTNEKALGMEPDTQNLVVTQAKVPVAVLEIGNLSNAQERKLLAKEEYREKIASGIVAAIEELLFATE